MSDSDFSDAFSSAFTPSKPKEDGTKTDSEKAPKTPAAASQPPVEEQSPPPTAAPAPQTPPPTAATAPEEDDDGPSLAAPGSMLGGNIAEVAEQAAKEVGVELPAAPEQATPGGLALETMEPNPIPPAKGIALADAPEPASQAHTAESQAAPAQAEQTAPPPQDFDDDDDDDQSPDSEDAPKRPMRIGERLISLGLISDDQLQIALQEQKRTKKLLGGILVDMGFLTESALTEVLAETAGSQSFDPESAVFDTALIRKIPKDVAIRQKVLAAAESDTTITIAMADVYNVLAIDQVRRFFNKSKRIVPVFCAETTLLELIDQYYDYEMSIDGILEEIETGIRNQNVQLTGEEDGYTNPTVRLVNAILVDAIKAGASDIHFEPEGSFLRLRYRVDGVLRQIRSLHRDYWSAIAVRIKIMSGMNIAETRNAQDGRITYKVTGREVDFRVATHPTVHGENIVMRLLDKTKSLVQLEKLGFSDHNIDLLKTMLKRPEGIIIVTGPTGSGKTTTLYSVLGYINSIEVNIMTLEDPVEYQLPLIRQTQVREGTGTDFVSGIKSLMRQDPDIIFIGEIRDEDTALMAVRAALTGHQVFSTLHTNDALGAIPRLLDIGVPAHLIAGTLIGTMAQRLARKLCNKCKEARIASPEECQLLGWPPDEPPTIYEPNGCEHCSDTGYKGRVAINEILRMDAGMDELIATHATRQAIMEYALENGFVRMQDDGVDKVIQGVIDLNELMSRIDMTERM